MIAIVRAAEKGLMRNVGLVSLSPIVSDSRVLRQIEALRNCCNLTVMALGEYAPPKGVVYKRLGTQSGIIEKLRWFWLLSRGRFQDYENRRYMYIRIGQIIEESAIECLLLNDYQSIGLAMRHRDKVITIDCHEFNYDERTGNPLIGYLLRRYLDYIRRCFVYADCCFTVSPTLAERWRRETGASFNVLYNSSSSIDKGVHARDQDSPLIKCVYIGIGSRSRKIETVMEAFRYLPKTYSCDLYLVKGSARYINKLKKDARKEINVEIRDPIVEGEITSVLSSYDISLSLIPPSCVNYKYSMPNKFFQGINAGLVSVVGDSPDMAEVIVSNRIGEVSKYYTAQSIAAAIGRAGGSLRAYKNNVKDIGSKFSWANEAAKLRLSLGLTDE